MLGASLQFGRGHGEDRFYNAAKARRKHHNHHGQNPQRPWSSGGGATAPAVKGEPENRVGSEERLNPTAVPSLCSSLSPASGVCNLSNLDRFLESTTPTIGAQYLSKTRMRGWRTCDGEYQPYFALGDLWESFKEWSAYGAGVPLVLNGSEGVVQYYVPYLSGIQLYGESAREPGSYRQACEDSDGDGSRDSSSEGSSDCEVEKGQNGTQHWNPNHFAGNSLLRLNRLSLAEANVDSQEGFSSDDGEAANSQGQLIFQYLEQNPPYCREPLADKISDLARWFPKLKTLRSCDLLPSSWVSVAWYPIYRIPTGPMLRDLDACFLTFHSLSTPIKGVANAPGLNVTYTHGVNGAPKICLPVFGLASYKFKGSIWTPNGGCEWQHVSSLLQAADDWLRLRQVHHPDYQFFASNGTFRR